jgi:hypothetical protein
MMKTTPWKYDTKTSLGNDTGAALTAGLMLLAVLTLVGATAISISVLGVEMSGNYRSVANAFYASEAGLQEAKGRLRGVSTAPNYAGDPAANPDPLWSAYILTSNTWQTSDDPHYDAAYQNYIPTTGSHTNTTITASSLQTDFPYWIKIRHKREYDAEQAGHTVAVSHYFDNDGSTATHTSAAAGNIVYYGYGNPATPTTAMQYTTAGATADKPVEIITAYGDSGGSSKIIEVEVVRNVGPAINSTIYTKGNVTGNGNSLFVNGNDNCGVAPSLPPIYTKTPSTTTLNGGPTLAGNPSTPQSGPDDLDIIGYISSLKTGATIVTTDQNGTNFGNSSNYVTIYSDTSNPPNVQGLKIQNGTGYGMLLVDGDLTLGGGFEWNGILLVSGTLVFNGGGLGINIRGTVLATQTVDINGGVDVRYDSCEVKKSLSNLPLVIISWKEAY